MDISRNKKRNIIFIIVTIGVVLILHSFILFRHEKSLLMSEVEKEQEKLSSDLMLQLEMAKSYMTNKAKTIELTYPSVFSRMQAQEDPFIEQDSDGSNRFTTMSGREVYYYGQTPYQQLNETMQSSVKFNAYYGELLVNTEDSFMNVSYYYYAPATGILMAYPFENEQITPNDVHNAVYEKYAKDFSTIDFKAKGHVDIRGDSLFIWEKIENLGNESYIGTLLYNSEDLLKFLDSKWVTYVGFIDGNNHMDIYQDLHYKTEVERPEVGDLHVFNTYSDQKGTYYIRGLDHNMAYVGYIDEKALNMQVINNLLSEILVLIVVLIIIVVMAFLIGRTKRYKQLKRINELQHEKNVNYRITIGSLMDTLSESYVKTDLHHQIIEINYATRQMLGYEASEIIGKNISNYMERPLDIRIRKERGRYNTYEVCLIHKDGSKVYGLANRSKFFKDIHGQSGYVFMVSDITKLIQARREAEEASRAKSRFIANLSHEIRTPMNAAKGYMYLMEQTTLDNAQKKYLDKMEYASKTLMEIIDEILEFSRIDSNKIVIEEMLVNCHDMVLQVVGLFEKGAIQKGIRLNVEIDENVPNFIWGDSHRLRQVLTNLMSNAFKFTRQGSVSIGLGVINGFKGNGNYIWKKKGTRIFRFIVKDTGIGISREYLESLFDPFVQGDESTTRAYGGTGLGLAITERLVNQMGGIIYVESRPNQGSTFYVEIPFKVYEKDETQPLPEPQQKKEEQKSLKILIVEDNILNQELMVALLTQKGHRVVIANNGQVAIEILESPHSTEFDLILMDIQMPLLDGFMTTQHIRSSNRYNAIHIIAVTASADEQTQRKIHESGMNDYVLKPIYARDLYERINQCSIKQ